MKNYDRHSWIGLIMVAIGGLLILGNFGFFDFEISHLIFSWRTIALVIGIIILSNSKNSIAGIIFVLIGLWGYITYILPWSIHLAFSDIWPLIFIIIGVSLLVRKKSPEQKPRHAHDNFTSSLHDTKEENSYNGDILDDVSIFTTTRRFVTSQNFRGGKVTSIFGGNNLDFASAKLSPEENHLEITCIFGACKIYVPRSWKVIVNVTSVFGGIDDKRYVNFEAQTSEGVMIIKGAVIFGGCEILSV